MCGIIGYIGNKPAVPKLIMGLKKLEYRGYDSAGISVANEGKLFTVKAQGRLSCLDRLLPALPPSCIGIGHTRWATHGEPSEINSHPHLSSDGNFAIVHNGIIENADELRLFLENRGFKIVSATDSEVIAHLIEYFYHGDMISALKKVSFRLKGAYALAIISVYNDRLYAIKKDSPLIIGLGQGENFIASDMTAVRTDCREYIVFEDGEIGVVTANEVKIYDTEGEQVEKPHFMIGDEEDETMKKGYPHYMLKEIFEQSEAIKKTLDAYPTPISFPADFDPDKIVLCACGSAYHAALLVSPLFSSLLGLPTTTAYASELRYGPTPPDEKTLFICVSQSGETADTLSSLRLAKANKALTAAIVNVRTATIAREAEITILTRAGAEIAVATTKGFTTQVAALYLMAYSAAIALKKAEPSDYENIRRSLRESADNLKALLSDLLPYQKTANEIYTAQNIFFIGRQQDYALAMEGALKLKEISYIHAESYPAGELKHGTISLIEKGSLCFAVVTRKDLKEKTMSNIKEVIARQGIVYVITPFADYFAAEAKVLAVPEKGAEFCATAIMQLIAYYTASLRGCDIDCPRNLAKSVTVE